MRRGGGNRRSSQTAPGFLNIRSKRHGLPRFCRVHATRGAKTYPSTYFRVSPMRRAVSRSMTAVCTNVSLSL